MVRLQSTTPEEISEEILEARQAAQLAWAKKERITTSQERLRAFYNGMPRRDENGVVKKHRLSDDDLAAALLLYHRLPIDPETGVSRKAAFFQLKGGQAAKMTYLKRWAAW